MKITATRPTYVETDKGETLLKKGESADVDGRKYSDSHPFVSAGYLVAEKAEPRRSKAKAETKQEDKPASDDTQEG